MEEKNIDIYESFQFGWNAAKKHLNFFVPFIVMILFVSFAPDILTKQISNQQSFFVGLINFASWILSMFLGMAAIKVSLLIFKNVQPKFSYLPTPFYVFSDYLVGVIIYTLIVMGGLLLFIVPGVILGIRYKYIPYLILDKGMKPIEALHKSDALTMNARMQLFLFGMLVIVINLAGFFLFFIGLFITVPVSWLAEVYVYNQLLEQSDFEGDVINNS